MKNNSFVFSCVCQTVICQCGSKIKPNIISQQNSELHLNKPGRFVPLQEGYRLHLLGAQSGGKRPLSAHWLLTAHRKLPLKKMDATHKSHYCTQGSALPNDATGRVWLFCWLPRNNCLMAGVKWKKTNVPRGSEVIKKKSLGSRYSNTVTCCNTVQ